MSDVLHSELMYLLNMEVLLEAHQRARLPLRCMLGDIEAA